MCQYVNVPICQCASENASDSILIDTLAYWHIATLAH